MEQELTFRRMLLGKLFKTYVWKRVCDQNNFIASGMGGRWGAKRKYMRDVAPSQEVWDWVLDEDTFTIG